MKQIRISAWAVQNPVPVVLLFVALTIAGLASYLMLPVKQFPDIDFPGVAVTVVHFAFVALHAFLIVRGGENRLASSRRTTLETRVP